MQEYPGDDNWGYTPRYFFASESSYGSTEQLKRLIDECHGRGIRVIMDGIFNHSHAESPLTQIDHDYWYHHSPRDPDNSWGQNLTTNTTMRILMLNRHGSLLGM